VHGRADHRVSRSKIVANPSPVAFLALLLVLPLTIFAFVRLKPLAAALWVVLGSILFLPERVGFDFPGLPSLDKRTLPALCLSVAVLLTARKKMREARVGRGVDLLLLLGFLQIVGSAFTNVDPLRYGDVLLPGHKPWDILSLECGMLLGTTVYFVLGRILVRSADDARQLLRAIVIAGLIYAPFCVVEMVMSPQWHNWIYGFAQHSWAQVMRDGGWRPMVFMDHGLALSLFMFGAAFSGWCLFKARTTILGLPAWMAALALTLLLTMLRSLGSLIYGIVAIPMTLLLGARAKLRLALVMGFLFCLYPLSRATLTFPTAELVDLSARVSQERAQSLEYRLKNDDLLVERALTRPAFGWGGFGRMYVFNESGRRLTIADGAWIVMLGSGGIVGLVIQFAMLQLPVLNAARRWRQIAAQDRNLLASVAVLNAFFAIDLLPNGMFNPLPMFLAGSVMGLSQGMALAPSTALNPELIRRWLLAVRRQPRRFAPNVRQS
jgi:hypothetical protein